MVGSVQDGIPEINYLERVKETLKHQGYVTAIPTITNDGKPGAATAHLRVIDGVVTIERDGKKLSIQNSDPDKTVARVKEFWRDDNHGWPTLKHKGRSPSPDKAAPASGASA